MAEDAWNGRDPAKVALAYTPDSKWRNRAELLDGRADIEAFLARKWNKELDCRLIKELWTFRGNRIAVRFACEYHDDSGNWFRACGNEASSRSCRMRMSWTMEVSRDRMRSAVRAGGAGSTRPHPRRACHHI